jgi:hypothetical protein
VHSLEANAHSLEADARWPVADAHSLEAYVHSLEADARWPEADAQKPAADAHSCGVIGCLLNLPHLHALAWDLCYAFLVHQRARRDEISLWRL